MIDALELDERGVGVGVGETGDDALDLGAGDLLVGVAARDQDGGVGGQGRRQRLGIELVRSREELRRRRTEQRGETVGEVRGDGPLGA